MKHIRRRIDRHRRVSLSRSMMALALLLGSSAAAIDVEMIAATGDPETTWPRWRGPSGQGYVYGSGYPDTWSSTDNVLWRTEVPGRGNSSPIVWGEQIFLTTSRDGGAERSLLSYSTSGELLWETKAPGADPEQAYPKNGHASSTATTDGERVYAYFGNHGLLATDLDGKLLWHTNLGPMDAFHGTASSPLLYEDRLFLVQDLKGSVSSFIAAFDAATGEELWRTQREAKVGWNSPVAIRVTLDDGSVRDEIVMSGQAKVIAYDPQTGEELWFAEGNTFETIPSPVVAHGLLFCSSGRAGPTLAIRPGGSGDVTETHIVWSSPKGSPFVPAPIVVGDNLFMVNDMAAVATVYEATTGEVRWQERLGRAKREGFSGSPVTFDEKVFFTNDDGETFVLRGGAPFEILHKNELDELTIATPALVGGVWYFRTASHLLAIGSKG